ncbi:MAG: signal peptidase II [Dehalococcoidia bacterium]|nr:signal peptidase II [Dehalococcoidia bacterium]
MSGNRLTWWNGLIFLLIAAAIVALDQLTKQWIVANIPLGSSLPAMGPLNIVNIQNTGSAFGLFPNQAFLLSLVAIAGLIMVLMFFRYFSELGFLGGIALSFIFAGAVGNLIDRIRVGYITDFIYVRLWGDVYWPAFNVADSAITIGAISLGVIALVKLRIRDESKPESAKKDI